MIEEFRCEYCGTKVRDPFVQKDGSFFFENYNKSSKLEEQNIKVACHKCWKKKNQK